MAKQGDLKTLLRTLEPALEQGKYCMGTFDESQIMGIAGYLQYIAGIFREKEGITAIFSDEVRREMSLYTETKIEGPFALITLRVISPLLSVGLLAKITDALAKEGIPANAFSAYYHDHILVPYEKRDEALAALKKLQKSA
jgi:uncharacterized protein